MNKELSLRSWAKENKVWEPESWKPLLIESLVPLYEYAYALNELYEFIKSEKISGKSSLSDIEDENLRNKVKVAIYGGVETNRDFNSSFAKFMYDNFGICAETASSFEESIKFYQNWGDGIKITVNPNSWINSISIKDLTYVLRNLIQKFCNKLNIKLSEIGIQETDPYLPTKIIKPYDFLPEAGEKPEKLVSLINEFKQKSLELSIGCNPFMTFVFYIRIIPLLVLMEFLGCDIDKITKLVNFLGIKAYSMIDQREVDLSTSSINKLFLIWETGITNYSFFDLFLILQKVLKNIDPRIKQMHESIINEAISQVHIKFEPWEDFEPLFLFWKETIEMGKTYVWHLLKSSNIFEVRYYTGDYYRRYPIGRSEYLSRPVMFSTLMMKVYPFISVGLIENVEYKLDEIGFKFHSLAKKWICKVIDSDGKT